MIKNIIVTIIVLWVLLLFDLFQAYFIGFAILGGLYGSVVTLEYLLNLLNKETK